MVPNYLLPQLTYIRTAALQPRASMLHDALSTPSKKGSKGESQLIKASESMRLDSSLKVDASQVCNTPTFSIAD